MITWPYILRAGHSDTPDGGACAMDAINWLVHGKHGAAPECACPTIASYVITGNDAMPSDVRQRLMPYLHRIAGSRSLDRQPARAEILYLASIRVFLPIMLDACVLPKYAEQLRALTTVTQQQVSRIAFYASQEAANRPYKRKALSLLHITCTSRSSASTLHLIRLVLGWYPAPKVWLAYFLVLEELLAAGPQGEPWSADVLHVADDLYRAAGGLVTA